jgi:copper transport protein
VTLRSRFLVLLLVLAAAGIVASAASAHATLERTSPGDGSRVAYSPAELRLWFSEDVSSRFREIRVVDGHGRVVQGAVVAGSGREVVVELPRLGDGTYGVLWHVLSEDDSHVTGGSFAFGVGDGPAVASPGSDSDGAGFSRVEAALRWLDFSLLAGLVGCLAFAALVLPRARRSVVSREALAIAGRRLLRAGLACALLAVIAGLLRLAWQAQELSNLGGGSAWIGGVADIVVGSRWGWAWIVRELALLGVLGVLLSLRPLGRLDLPASRGRVSVAGVLLAVGVAAHAATSHAAALERATVTAVAGNAVHVLGAATWLGGAAAFVVVLWPVGGLERPDSAALGRACRRPFAELAAFSVGLVLATGLYSAGRQVASVDALFTSAYGHALLVKTGVVTLALAFGALNFALLRSRARSGTAVRLAGSRRLLLPEVVLGATAFLAAAVVASSVPARGPQYAPPRQAVVTKRSGSVADLVVTASATPTRAGSNAFTVLVASSRRPPPAPLSGVTLEIRNGSAPVRSIPLQEVEPGRYFGTADLDESGRSGFTFVVERRGERFQVPFSWSIGAPDPARPVTFSSRRLAPILNGAAAFLLVLTLVGGAWVLVGRPRPRHASGAVVGRVQERAR